MRTTTLAIFGLLAFNLTIGGRAFGDPVTIKDGAVAPSPDTPGQGLCMASSLSTNPASDFSQNEASFNASVNDFMETHQGDRVYSVLSKPFDLSNNNNTGNKVSHGDFIDAVAGCDPGGCDFAFNDSSQPFASRLRGYLNVTEPLVNKPIHFGLYLDDAASLTIVDKFKTEYSVIKRPPTLGAPTWRSTNTVTFEKAGLYPIEILYVGITEHSALEASLFEGTFSDFELPATDPNSKSLKEAGFTLLDPSLFHQTITGAPSFPDPASCMQCDKQYADLPGNTNCPPGMYCNSAALCSPCATDMFCGPTCSPCQGDVPFCTLVEDVVMCAACGVDAHCGEGKVCKDNQCISDGSGEGGAGGNGAGGGATSGAGGDGGPDGGESGGCDCRASGGTGGSGGLAALLASALMAALRRRRAALRPS